MIMSADERFRGGRERSTVPDFMFLAGSGYVDAGA
jgi:hypothetical protein